MHDGMSLAAHDDEVGPLLASRLLQLGCRIAGTNLERPWDAERVQRLGGPLARQLLDRAKRLLRVARHGHGGRRQRHRRDMADMHGRKGSCRNYAAVARVVAPVMV